MTLRPVLTLFILLISSGGLLAISASYPDVASLSEEDNERAKLYIHEYAPIAIQEMKRIGVPASISLAQGMLESAFGQSELARLAHNHFGIKCHKAWEGETYYCGSKEFTAQGFVESSSCFRKYANVVESYKDHSNFLASRSHYKNLFTLEVTDYERWAQGLYDAGYATDPKYAQKLVAVIEQYQLDKYDEKGNVVSMLKNTDANAESVNELKAKIVTLENVLVEAERYRSMLVEEQAFLRERIMQLESEQETLRKDLNNKMMVLDQSIMHQQVVIIDMQDRLHQVENIQQNMLKSDPLSGFFNEDGSAKNEPVIFPKVKTNAQGIFYQSGRKATVYKTGMSLIGIAQKYSIEYRDLLRFNDLEDEMQLVDDCYIYLESKASYVKSIQEPHQVQIGETMHYISQRYGIRLTKLYQRNQLKKGDEPEIGEFIFLNSMNEDKPSLRVDADSNPNFNGGGANPIRD